MAAAIRLYLDECLTPKIAIQVRKLGIDIVSVHELALTGDSDPNHLARATEMSRVLVTADDDFLTIAASGVPHAGIIHGEQSTLSIGDWVRALELICAVYEPEDMLNHVEYL